MSDKELIKQEIERLKNEQLSIFSKGENEEIYGTALTCIGVYNQLLSFINSLPEEHNEDLEEEIDRYYLDWQFDDDTIYEDMRNICRHFAEWQKQKDDKHIGDLQWEAYLTGEQETKQQMMKDAVDATIVNDWQYGKDQDHAVIPAIHQRIDGFNVGDKVKIIIVKEKQQ